MLEKIISGGQSGVDRTALDFALARGIPHGGWCPRGRLAEDGVISGHYGLSETPDASVLQRTEWNVRDSDGTVIFSTAPALAGGAQRTADFALRHHKPCLHLSREREGHESARRLAKFLNSHHIRILNVAGPRRSEDPAAAEFAREILERCLGSCPSFAANLTSHQSPGFSPAR